MSAVPIARLADALLPDVIEAGRIQMSVFRTGATVVTKSDDTPVTEADQRSEARLIAGLKRVAPDIPVVAEESSAAGRTPVIDTEFFLVDPLDGTREFIAGRPDFTINIALIRSGRPVFGLIYAPAREELYFTREPGEALGATMSLGNHAPTVSDLETRRLRARRPPADGLVVATSQSHMNAATERFLEPYSTSSRIRMGSSLKFCLIARGDADIYPRIGRTSEWDTAAGQAILEAAGGSVTRLDGTPLTYGHADRRFLNPDYVARGLPDA
ncbi:MAG TPA: 3'(2'),5'-bisphosphate nucleotidase CysQ [Hyphomicrobiaceae bacterium]|nr:3'(2'),5'-bisphosphate nucleotidase CysQ [Hyphomicrobiaceae bacterium]